VRIGLVEPVDLSESGVSGGGVYGEAVRGGEKILKSLDMPAMFAADEEGESLLSVDSLGPAETRRRKLPTTRCIG